MLLLDWDEDRVLGAVESGVFEFAWDISRKGMRRREIRIWQTSVVEHLLAIPGRARSHDQVLQAIFPQRAIRSNEL